MIVQGHQYSFSYIELSVFKSAFSLCFLKHSKVANIFPHLCVSPKNTAILLHSYALISHSGH